MKRSAAHIHDENTNIRKSKKNKKKKQLCDITNVARPTKKRKKSNVQDKINDARPLNDVSSGVLTRSQKAKLLSGVPVPTGDILLESSTEKLDALFGSEPEYEEEEKMLTSENVEDEEEKFVDIDMIHADDEKYPIEYARDIYDNARDAEVQYHPDNIDYMSTLQIDINEGMRSILVDWLIEVADEYKLESKTLHLSISTIDRVLSKRSVKRGSLQLVGCACMLLAGKYEEIFPPTVEDYSYISDNTYTPNQVLEEERRVLQDIDYTLTVPTTHTYLNRFLSAAEADKKQRDIAKYFSEIMLLHVDFIRFVPSMCAATSVYYMRLLTVSDDEIVWTRTLQHYTDYLQTDLQECCQILHKKHCSTKTHELRAVYDKFACPKYSQVADIEPLAELPFSF